MQSSQFSQGEAYLPSLRTVVLSSPSSLDIRLLGLWVDAVVLESQHCVADLSTRVSKVWMWAGMDGTAQQGHMQPLTFWTSSGGAKGSNANITMWTIPILICGICCLQSVIVS